MFGREIRTKLSQLHKPGMTKAFIVAKANDLKKKKKLQQKIYTNSRQRAVSSPVKEGDRVFLQQPPRDKLSTQYDPQPYTVMA